MPYIEAIRLALESIRTSKLRSFFTLLGIIVSVGFLVAVVAIIQGLNAYVKENIAEAVTGTNAFQVRRTPIAMRLESDDEVRKIAKRPLISNDDAAAVKAALPDAEAVALQSGWPTPSEDLKFRNRMIGSVTIFGVTPEYQLVQDFQLEAGLPLTEPDVREHRLSAFIGWDVADKLFEGPDRALGKKVRIVGREVVVKGVFSKKPGFLGQSVDGYILLPITTFESIYGRRLTTTVSVKVRAPAQLPAAMARAEEAMRISHRLRPMEDNDFTIDKADALISFWSSLTALLFTVMPTVVSIGVLVGGIVIMNIMLMSITERTHEIGIRKSLGARPRDIRRQFLVEAVTLAVLGGILGVLSGASLASLIATVTPLPARVTLWSVLISLAVGAGTGVVFGVYPASRAARLDPIAALRAE